MYNVILLLNDRVLTYTYPAHDLLSLASDSGSEEVFCLLRTTLLPPSPAGGWPVAPGVTGIPGANRKTK